VSQIEVDTAKGIPEKTVYLAPLTPSCLFRQVDLYLNTTLVSTSSNNYPYRAYFETLLSFPSTVKKDMLTALEHIDGVQLAESKRGSVSLECLTRIYLDMFSQSKMLIPGVSLHLRLCRNSDDFIFHIPTTGSSNYQIELEEACLYIEHVTPNPSIALEHERRLARETCVYPISRSVVRAYHIPSGLQGQTFNNCFNGILPRRIIVGLVDATDYNGNGKSSPFAFKNFSLSQIYLQVNGRSLPTQPYEPNFTKNSYRRSYLGLLETVLGESLDDKALGISINDYKTSKALYGFTISHANDIAVPQKTNGNINLCIKFSSALTTNVTAIVFAEFENKIEIDSARNVSTDF